MAGSKSVKINSPSSFGKRILGGVRDLTDGFARWRIWTAFAWEDIKLTYRRTVIGVLWISVSFAAFVLVKLVIFGPMVGRVSGDYFAPYLLLGFFSWQYMSNIINSAPTTFLANQNWIFNDAIPYSVYVYQSVMASILNLVFTLLVVIGFYIYFSVPIGLYALLAFPAIAIYIINAIWVKLLLGVICARFRDVMHLTHTVMRFMFFLTPIFWFPEQMPEQLMKFLWWNPFAHFLWIFRTPILDNEPAFESWIFVCVVTAAGWALTIIVFGAFRRRIPFWF